MKTTALILICCFPVSLAFSQADAKQQIRLLIQAGMNFERPTPSTHHTDKRVLNGLTENRGWVLALGLEWGESKRLKWQIEANVTAHDFEFSELFGGLGGGCRIEGQFNYLSLGIVPRLVYRPVPFLGFDLGLALNSRIVDDSDALEYCHFPNQTPTHGPTNTSSYFSGLLIQPQFGFGFYIQKWSIKGELLPFSTPLLTQETHASGSYRMRAFRLLLVYRFSARFLNRAAR